MSLGGTRDGRGARTPPCCESQAFGKPFFLRGGQPDDGGNARAASRGASGSRKSTGHPNLRRASRKFPPTSGSRGVRVAIGSRFTARARAHFPHPKRVSTPETRAAATTIARARTPTLTSSTPPSHHRTCLAKVVSTMRRTTAACRPCASPLPRRPPRSLDATKRPETTFRGKFWQMLSVAAGRDRATPPPDRATPPLTLPPPPFTLTASTRTRRPTVR